MRRFRKMPATWAHGQLIGKARNIEIHAQTIKNASTASPLAIALAEEIAEKATALGLALRAERIDS